MPVTFRPAVRENSFVMIGVIGGTGSGKTYSALRLATGLAGGKPFALIDTEAGRGLHYADQFNFDHGDLRAPFRPDAYAQAVKDAAAAGYKVICIDSMSHEHAGTGGLLDWHDEEVARMGGSEAVNIAAWIKPKMAHKRMMNDFLELEGVHIVFCFRAEQKVEIAKDERGKTVVRPKKSVVGLDGWIPVCEKNLPYELTMSFLLTAERPGYPQPIKLQEQHKAMVPLDQPISEATGVALAAWASSGAAAGTAVAGEAGSSEEAPQRPDEPVPAIYATRADAARLHAIREAHDVPPERLQQILQDVTGQTSTLKIPAELFPAIVAMVEMGPVKA